MLNSSIGALGLLFVNHLFRGPLGEELGWRGFLQNELEIKHSALKSSLIVGLLWGILHLPLWMISGYTGIELDIATDMTLSIMIGVRIDYNVDFLWHVKEHN